METRDIDELQSSFSAVFAQKADLAERFYHHLFVLLPEVKPLFGADFLKQKEMFASILTSCLKGMVSNQNLSDVSNTLTRVHAEFDLGPREMDLAGQAMMAAFKDILGQDLTPTQSAAWQKAADRVMGMMAGRDLTP